MKDQEKYKKPESIKDSIWRMHLNWMDVAGGQAEENLKKIRQQKKHTK